MKPSFLTCGLPSNGVSVDLGYRGSQSAERRAESQRRVSLQTNSLTDSHREVGESSSEQPATPIRSRWMRSGNGLGGLSKPGPVGPISLDMLRLNDVLDSRPLDIAIQFAGPNQTRLLHQMCYRCGSSLRIRCEGPRGSAFHIGAGTSGERNRDGIHTGDRLEFRESLLAFRGRPSDRDIV